MVIPLKSDKSIDVTLSGYSNVGYVYVKIFSLAFLKDCDDLCWSCTTTDRNNCTSCKTNYYLSGTICVS